MNKAEKIAELIKNEKARKLPLQKILPHESIKYKINNKLKEKEFIYISNNFGKEYKLKPLNGRAKCLKGIT